MRPSIWLVAIVALAAGCRTPTRIPPPPTGEFGSGDPYYNGIPSEPPSTSAPATRQSSGASRSVSSTFDLDSDDDGESELAWTTPQRVSDSRGTPIGATIRRDTDNGVRQARYDDLEDSAEQADYSPGTTRGRTRIDLKGMPVNDATNLLPVPDFEADLTSTSSARTTSTSSAHSTSNGSAWTARP